MRNIIVVSFYNYIENRNTKFVVLTGLVISTDHFTMTDDETTDCVVDDICVCISYKIILIIKNRHFYIKIRECRTIPILTL